VVVVEADEMIGESLRAASGGMNYGGNIARCVVSSCLGVLVLT
jgi:hypothetical protein